MYDDDDEWQQYFASETAPLTAVSTGPIELLLQRCTTPTTCKLPQKTPERPKKKTAIDKLTFHRINRRYKRPTSLNLTPTNARSLLYDTSSNDESTPSETFKKVRDWKTMASLDNPTSFLSGVQRSSSTSGFESDVSGHSISDPTFIPLVDAISTSVSSADSDLTLKNLSKGRSKNRAKFVWGPNEIKTLKDIYMANYPAAQDTYCKEVIAAFGKLTDGTDRIHKSQIVTQVSKMWKEGKKVKRNEKLSLPLPTSHNLNPKSTITNDDLLLGLKEYTRVKEGARPDGGVSPDEENLRFFHWSLEDDAAMNECIEGYKTISDGMEPCHKELEALMVNKTDVPRDAVSIKSRRRVIKKSKKNGTPLCYPFWSKTTESKFTRLINSNPNTPVRDLCCQFWKDNDRKPTFDNVLGKFRQLKDLAKFTLSEYQMRTDTLSVVKWTKLEDTLLMAAMNLPAMPTPAELKENLQLNNKDETDVTIRMAKLRHHLNRINADDLYHLSQPTQKITSEVAIMEKSLTKAEKFASLSGKNLHQLQSFNLLFKRLHADHPDRLVSYADWDEIAKMVKHYSCKGKNATDLCVLVHEKFSKLPYWYLKSKLDWIILDPDFRERDPFTRPQISLQQLTFQSVVAGGKVKVSIESVYAWIRDKYEYYSCVNFRPDVKRILTCGLFCTTIVLGIKFYSIHIDYLSQIDQIVTADTLTFEKFRKFNRNVLMCPKNMTIQMYHNPKKLADVRDKFTVENAFNDLMAARNTPHISILYGIVFVNKRIKRDFNEYALLAGIEKHLDEVYPFYLGANSNSRHNDYDDPSVMISAYHKSNLYSMVAKFVSLGFDAYQVSVTEFIDDGTDAINKAMQRCHGMEALKIWYGQACLSKNPDNMFRIINRNVERSLINLNLDQVKKMLEDATSISPIVMNCNETSLPFTTVLDPGVFRKINLDLPTDFISKVKINVSEFDNFPE